MRVRRGSSRFEPGNVLVFIAFAVMIGTVGVLFAPRDAQVVPVGDGDLRSSASLATSAADAATSDAVSAPAAPRSDEPSSSRATMADSIAPWTRRVPEVIVRTRDGRGPFPFARVFAILESRASGIGDEFESIELGVTDESGVLRASLRRACSLHAITTDGASSCVATFAPGDRECTLFFDSIRSRRVGVRDAKTKEPLVGIELACLDLTRPSGVWLVRRSDDVGWLTPDLPPGAYRMRSVDPWMVVRESPEEEPTSVEPSWSKGDVIVVESDPLLDPSWVDVERVERGSLLRIRALASESGKPLPRASVALQTLREDRGEWSGRAPKFVATDDGWLEVAGVERLAERFTIRVAVDAPGRHRGFVIDPSARLASGVGVAVSLEPDPTTAPAAIEIEIGDDAVADAIACCRGQHDFAVGEFEDGVLRFADLAPGEHLVGPYDLVRFARYGGKQSVEEVGRAPSPSEERVSKEDRGGMSMERHGDDVRRSSRAPQPGECRPSSSAGCDGLDHLPLHRVTVIAGETTRLAWDPRWTPTERLAGRVDAIGIDPARLHVVADHGPLGAKIHLDRDMRRVAVSSDGTFELRDLVATPLRFLAVLVDPSGCDRILAEGAIDVPLRVRCGGVEIAVAGIDVGATALVELRAGPGATEVRVPTQLTLRVGGGSSVRVDDLPIGGVSFRFLKEPHVPRKKDWEPIELEAGITRRVTLIE